MPEPAVKPQLMKNLISAAAACFLLCLVFQSCKKDGYQTSYTYSYYVPVYRTMAEVRANIKSNPAQPVQHPGKVYIMGTYIFLTETDQGIHVFDNSDPRHPQNISFIDIPSNMDLAVKGHTLYADLFTDLVAIDITNPRQVVLKKVVENIFPERQYNTSFLGDSSLVIVRWERKD